MGQLLLAPGDWITSSVPPGEAPLNEYFPRINIPVL